MGRMYLARSEGGRTVAVKVVRAEFAGQDDFRQRFAREIDAARRVGGDWTAPVLDFDTSAATPWVATGYVPGPDLRTVVTNDYGPLPERSLHVLANRLALALGAIHDAGREQLGRRAARLLDLDPQGRASGVPADKRPDVPVETSSRSRTPALMPGVDRA
jgi:serine/threonine protein kinase